MKRTRALAGERVWGPFTATALYSLPCPSDTSTKMPTGILNGIGTLDPYIIVVDHISPGTAQHPFSARELTGYIIVYVIVYT